MARNICVIDGCDSFVKAHGWCNKHYIAFRRYGDPLARKQDQWPWPGNLLRRLRFEPNGCIEFTGSRNQQGYGKLGTAKGCPDRCAHRAAYILVRGPIPDGLELDHTCENPPCVNPAHLDPVTVQEHARRGVARRTHCKKGHELTPGNTFHRPEGGRRCRICRNEKDRRRRASRKAAK